MEKDLTLEELIARRNHVSLSKSVYINSEGHSFVELHTIASRLNKLAYDDGLDVTLKVEG